MCFAISVTLEFVSMRYVFQIPADVVGVCKHAGDIATIITKTSRKVRLILWCHTSHH